MTKVSSSHEQSIHVSTLRSLKFHLKHIVKQLMIQPRVLIFVVVVYGIM